MVAVSSSDEGIQNSDDTQAGAKTLQFHWKLQASPTRLLLILVLKRGVKREHKSHTAKLSINQDTSPVCLWSIPVCLICLLRLQRVSPVTNSLFCGSGEDVSLSSSIVFSCGSDYLLPSGEHNFKSCLWTPLGNEGRSGSRKLQLHKLQVHINAEYLKLLLENQTSCRTLAVYLHIVSSHSLVCKVLQWPYISKNSIFSVMAIWWLVSRKLQIWINSSCIKR